MPRKQTHGVLPAGSGTTVYSRGEVWGIGEACCRVRSRVGGDNASLLLMAPPAAEDRSFYWSGEVAACTEKYPGEGSSSFDRQVTDRRWHLPGKYSQGSRQKEFCRQLPADSEPDLSLLAAGSAGDFCGGHVLALSFSFSLTWKA